LRLDLRLFINVATYVSSQVSASAEAMARIEEMVKHSLVAKGCLLPVHVRGVCPI
jgi:hypothetical protein